MPDESPWYAKCSSQQYLWTRRSVAGVCFSVTSVPLLYRGITVGGRWF